LPTNLIDAFKSTLDEIVNSDLILHIRDSSDDEYLLQKKDVLNILFELGIRDDDPRIMEVNNKIDLLEHSNRNFKSNGIRISSISGDGINYLKSSISDKLEKLYKDSFLLKQSYKA
jgi:GTP-binding protein HflX